MPATPESRKTVCARCGTPYGLSLQPFRFGSRELDLPACQSCWKRYVASRMIRWAALVVGVLAAAGGIALSVVTSGMAPALVGILIGVGAIVGALLFHRASRPKRVKGEGVVIKIPSVGPVRVD